MTTKRKTEERIITAWQVLAWIVSIFSFLIGTIEFMWVKILGLPLILAGLVIFPPFDKFIRETYNIRFSRGLKILLVFILWFIWLIASFILLS